MQDNKKKFFRGANLITLVLITGGVFCVAVFLSLFVPYSFLADKKIAVYIEYGSGIAKTAATLKTAGLIRNTFAFKVYGYLSGKYKTIKAGEYEIPENTNMVQIVDKLVRGEFVRHEIIIPEGSDSYDIAETLVAGKVIETDAAFLSAVRDRKILSEQGLPFASFEGFLFPETYNFLKGQSPEKIIGEMYVLFKRKTGLNPLKEYQISGVSLKGYEVLILASIIEKEAKVDTDRPLVASVFYNRIKEGKRLESCATVRYAMNKRKGIITLEDLRF